MSYEGENNRPELSIPPVSFEEYRSFCDGQSESYRKVGVLSPEGYDSALSSDETEFIDVPSLGVVPLVVSDVAMDGYDIGRTKELTGSTSLFLLALPVEAIPDDVRLRGDYTSSVIVVESSRPETAAAKSRLPKILGGDSALVSCDFVDERIEQEDNKTAWMALYTAKTRIVDETRIKPGKSMKDINAELGGELRPDNGLTLYSGEDLASNQDIADKLWDLFKDRFGWLGDNHPVSMEDTRELFDQLVMGNDSYVTVKYMSGEPICAGIFMHDLDDCTEWLSGRCVDMLMARVDEGYTPMFFPGIAARTEGMGSAKELISYHCRLASEAGIRYALSFESSNMSSTYIPRLVSDYVRDSGTLELVEEVESQGKQDYWYLKQV